jgi:predicted SAM-dependent methyltransferase
MKLHIGGQTRNSDWKIFNINPGPEVDFTGDCRDLSQFADGSIDTIYASHVLEHIPYQKDLPKTLVEWRRALRPGGTLMVSVPDLEILCRLFLHPKLSAENRFQIMRMMFGGQIDAHDFHYVGLTLEFLGDYLAKAGFDEISRVESFGLFEDTSVLKVGGIPISLNVTAKKPS